MVGVIFDACFAIVVATEGGFTANAADPGCWTGGKIGVGKLAGTKYGISAASYPDVEIATLTIDGSKALYKRDYWDKIAGDSLPGPLALIVFDSAVNSGDGRAERWLQQALGVTPDGEIGPATLAAIEAHAGHGAELFAEVLALRIVFDASLPTWPGNALGWSRRLAKLPFQALAIGA